ncbi:MAG TPA: BON domain-containing protein [Actinocrinis sp.]|nr:BON domain-containing protein [Actinocrinis sp.]
MTQTLHRSDAELKSAVTDELAWTAGVDNAHIGVAVMDGGVTLSGEVDSYPEKLIAEHAAMRVRGITAVAQEITVRNQWMEMNDTDIAREAREALERAVDVPVGTVNATVHDHILTLTGQVPWQFQREAAGRAVHSLRGVRDIANAVAIRPTVSTADIKNAISAALVRSARLEGKATTVTADAAGTVTLQGVVHSASERREAERTAWSAPGVVSVDNRLRIEN